MGSLAKMLDHVQNHTDLDVIAVTDHDDIEGGYLARELAAKRNYTFEVVVGTEVTTLEGHLLALYLEKPVRSLQSLNKTVQAIHAQGGLCIVPHPMSWVTRSVGRRALERVAAGSTEGIYLDGLEVINATVAGRVTNDKALTLNRSHFRLAETGGSDAHFPLHIGSAFTRFQGSSAEDLRKSLRDKITQAARSEARSPRVGAHEILGQQVKSLILLPIKHVRRKVRRLLAKRHDQ